MVTKAHILAEITRTAKANKGVPLGVRRFYAETGVKVTDWLGKYWSKWGDAISEAPLSQEFLGDSIHRRFFQDSTSQMSVAGDNGTGVDPRASSDIEQMMMLGTFELSRQGGTEINASTIHGRSELLGEGFGFHGFGPFFSIFQARPVSWFSRAQHRQHIAANRALAG